VAKTATESGNKSEMAACVTTTGGAASSDNKSMETNTVTESDDILDSAVRYNLYVIVTLCKYLY
jgi:hypothetical protein